jgi:hypothetical protein
MSALPNFILTSNTFSMKAALVLALLPLASAYHNGFISDTPKTFDTFSNQTDPSTVCGLLKQKFSNLTFIPTDAGYQKENEGSLDHKILYKSLALTIVQSLGHLQHGSVQHVSSLPAMQKTSHGPSKYSSSTQHHSLCEVAATCPSLMLLLSTPPAFKFPART